MSLIKSTMIKKSITMCMRHAVRRSKITFPQLFFCVLLSESYAWVVLKCSPSRRKPLPCRTLRSRLSSLSNKPEHSPRSELHLFTDLQRYLKGWSHGRLRLHQVPMACTLQCSCNSPSTVSAQLYSHRFEVSADSTSPHAILLRSHNLQLDEVSHTIIVQPCADFA